MKILIRLVGVLVCALAISAPAHAVYLVRIADLKVAPTPPNPVKIVGTVTSASPLKVSDGSGEVELTGITGGVGDYLVVEGSWNGSTLAASQSAGKSLMYSAGTMTEMVYVPAGSFLMGNNGSEGYSNDNELPQHSVQLSGYWIGRYAVTRGEYAKFMAAGGYSNASYWSADGWAWLQTEMRTQPGLWDTVQNWGDPPGNFTQTDRHPVAGVSYYEAEAYCNWAGGHLPTEAQWEKASRWDGHSRVYPWGDIWDSEKCNNTWDTLFPGAQSSPVGSYPAGVSPYGCYDMSGNLFEWCSDWYDDYYYSATPAGGWVDPTGPGPGTYRVLRGGCWYVDDDLSRCSSRGKGTPFNYWSYYGLRIAR